MRTLLPTLAAIAVAAVLVVLIDPLRIALSYALHGDIDALQVQLQDLGVAGALVLVAIILVHAVVLFPAEIPNAVAGLVYGFAVALPLVLAAWVASGLIAYGLGAWIGRPLAVRIAGEERVATAEHVIGRGGAPALLMARLIPFVPFSLVGYIAGRRPRARLALHVDVGRRRAADHRRRHLPRPRPGRLLALGPAGVGRRRHAGDAGRADGDVRAADARSLKQLATARAGAAGRGSRRRSGRCR